MHWCTGLRLHFGGSGKRLESVKAKIRRRQVERVGEAAVQGAPSATLAAELLSYFYPMHYRVGVDLEVLMCQGRIARKQAAILWLVHTRADPAGWVRRREIEERLSTWFEISNSNISKLLRDLTRTPTAFVTQIENPQSGREKLVRLTKAGEAFAAGMIEASVAYLSQRLAHLNADEFRWGIAFFALAFHPPSPEARQDHAALRLSPPPGRIARAPVRRAQPVAKKQGSERRR